MAIHQEATFPVAPERVYELLTNGAKLGEVTSRPGKGGGSAGAYFSLFDEWLEGRQIELVLGERVVQAWRFTDWDPGVYSIVRFTLTLTLTPDGDGTKLTVDQDGYPADLHEHLSTNWRPFYFDPMANISQFRGAPSRDRAPGREVPRRRDRPPPAQSNVTRTPPRTST